MPAATSPAPAAAEVLAAKRLTPYAVAGRYPGVSEDASEEDYREALVTAEETCAWAERLVGRRPQA